MITEGKMQYLYDDKGRRYLDVSPVTAFFSSLGACTYIKGTVLQMTWPCTLPDPPCCVFLTKNLV